MFHNSTVESIRSFYVRWSATVFRFCELFVGDRSRAETATEVTFLRYFRAGQSLDSEVTPVPLLRMALEAAQSQDGEVGSAVRDLPGAIRGLPFDQRSVFILRSVLDFDLGKISEITGCTQDQIQRTWLQGMIQLRDLLPTHFFKEWKR